MFTCHTHGVRTLRNVLRPTVPRMAKESASLQTLVQAGASLSCVDLLTELSTRGEPCVRLLPICLLECVSVCVGGGVRVCGVCVCVCVCVCV